MLRNQSAKLDTNYHEKETSLNNLKTRYAVLEQVGIMFFTESYYLNQL